MAAMYNNYFHGFHAKQTHPAKTTDVPGVFLSPRIGGFPDAMPSRETVPKANGFSLVELLVVVVLAGILGAMLFGSLDGVRDRSHLAKCTANMRQLHTGFMLYAAENRNTLPAYRRTAEPNPNVPGDTGRYEFWYTNLNPYVPVTSRAFACPAEPRSGELPSYYGMNANIPMHLPIHNVTKPSRFFLLADSERITRITAGARTDEEIAYRHSGGSRTNLLFLDGHVEARLLEEIPSSIRVNRNSAEYKDFWLGED